MKISSALPSLIQRSPLQAKSPLPAASGPQDHVELHPPAPVSGETLSRQSGIGLGGMLLGLGAGVATILLAGCSSQPTPEQPLLSTQVRGDFGEYRGDFQVQDGHVQGDFGEYRGDYQVQDGHVSGDLGEYRGDFQIQDGHVFGDFGEYRGDYQVSHQGNTTRVVGDFGEYRGDYQLVQEGNVTHVFGYFGEYRGDFNVTVNPDGSQHVAGDFGEYRGDYTVTPEAGGFHVQGDFGEYRGDYHIGGEAARDNSLLHPLGVGSLLSPDSPHAPARWPSAIRTDDSN